MHSICIQYHSRGMSSYTSSEFLHPVLYTNARMHTVHSYIWSSRRSRLSLTDELRFSLSLSLSLSLIPTSKGQQVGVWPILRYGIRCDGQANCVRELPRAEDSVRYEGKQMNHILSTFRGPIFLSSMMSHFQG